MTHRSWLTCSSCFFLRAMSPSNARSLRRGAGAFAGGRSRRGALLLLLMGRSRLQTLTHELRVHSLLNRKRAFEHQELVCDRFTRADLELSGHRQAANIGQSHSVNRGYERDSDSFANLRDVREVAHDLNEAENGADDPDRRGITSGGLEHFGNVFALLLQV